MSHALRRVLARITIALGAPRVRKSPRGRPATAFRPRAIQPSSPLLFEICTFVNDDRQYEAMRSSFESVGFRPPVATFARLSAGNDRAPDPFAAITRLGSEQGPPYAILCHQDVLLDQGPGLQELAPALARLDELDRTWVVAGNAGATSDLRLVRRLVDPHGGGTGDRLPARVVSLDENFLILNRRRSPRCSAGLRGFHFYGTDVCLNAMADGGTAYVIDFPLTHLSRGTIGGEYVEARRRFLAAWNPRYRFTYVRTQNELLFMSRFVVLRRLFGSTRAFEWVLAAAPAVRLQDRHSMNEA